MLVKDLGSCKKHRVPINRVARLAKSVLESLESSQELFKTTLVAYEDCIHDCEELKAKNLLLVRQLEDLGEVPAVGDGNVNPSQGEAGEWSPQRNVNLEHRFNEDGSASIAQRVGDVVADDDSDVYNSDDTRPMSPSPVKSQRGRASGSPTY